MKLVWRVRFAVGVALTAMLGLLGPAGANAAGNGSVWGSPLAYGSTGQTVSIFASISCARAGDCVAVGDTVNLSSHQPPEAAIAVESAGTWGPVSTLAQLPNEPPAASGGESALDSVSCSSATSCVAVGVYEGAGESRHAMVVPIAVSGPVATAGAALPVALPSEAETGAKQRARLDGVSCSSAGDCVAVGSYVDVSGAVLPMTAAPGSGDWTASAVAHTPAETGKVAFLDAISCPASGACEAVGGYENASNYLYPWAVQLANGQPGTAQPVALPADFKPRAGAIEPYVGAFSEGLVAVSCPSAGVCTAAGSYPDAAGGISAYAVPIVSGAPGVVAGLSGGGQPFEEIRSIWCSDANDCTVAGDADLEVLSQGAVGSETAGVWSPLAKLPNEGGDLLQYVSAMSCVSVTRCVAAGIQSESFLLGETGFSAFFAYSAPALSLPTSTLPAATVGAPYSATLQAAGGTGAYSWSLAAGSLPAGLSLNATTGVISGTPTSAGQSGFVVSAKDAGPPAQSVSTSLSIAVAAAPQPASPPAPTPVVQIVRLKTSAKKATVVLTCAGAPCAGSLAIDGVVKIGRAKAKAVLAKAKGPGAPQTKTIALAKRSYALPAGGSQLLTFTLKRAARQLLRRLGTISGDLYVTPLGATQPALVEQLTFRSRPKRATHGHSKHTRRKHSHRSHRAKRGRGKTGKH